MPASGVISSVVSCTGSTRSADCKFQINYEIKKGGRTTCNQRSGEMRKCGWITWGEVGELEVG
jgi:hypothetical protein